MKNNYFVGKKRLEITEESLKIFNSNINNNSFKNSNSILKNSTNEIPSTSLSKFENEGLSLTNHTHWVNKILILEHQPFHNLISTSADGLIIIYNSYPNFDSILKIKEFNNRGVTYLTELQNSTIIACSFGAIKHIKLNFIDNNNCTYIVLKYYPICKSYISKCIELSNKNIVLICQEYNIFILENNKKIENAFNENISSIKLLDYEICITILELHENLIMSASITDHKFNLKSENIYNLKLKNNFITFYDKDFNIIHKINNIYCSKSADNVTKLNERYFIISAELCMKEDNWDNNKGIALVDYKLFQIITFVETNKQISSLFLLENVLMLGDNNGFVEKYEITEKKELKEIKTKKVHLYNINSIIAYKVYDEESQKNILLTFTGSNDKTIKITSFFDKSFDKPV